ncbi:hypothetical protein ACFX2B_025228 [Malus domestica]
MGPQRSTRLNVILGGAVPPPQGSTMATTEVATMAITRGEVYGSTTTAQAMLSKAHTTKATTRTMSLHAQHEPNVFPIRAQASHLHAPCIEQPDPVTQPTSVIQPASAAQPAPATQPTLII